MNTTVLINRRELEYSVSGLMHPQYPAPDIKHLIDRLHTRDALRFEDLEISGPVELFPGCYLEAAGAHTEGSMNVHVDTLEGRATICGDVIYDFNDQIVTPFHEISSNEPRTTGNHGVSKREEKAAIKKLPVETPASCCPSTTSRPGSPMARSSAAWTCRCRAR
jgi:hypothetical protein